MAPEVAARKPYNGKADVYGFGMILWEMAAMRKPFEGVGRELFFEMVVNGNSKASLTHQHDFCFLFTVHCLVHGQ